MNHPLQLPSRCHGLLCLLAVSSFFCLPATAQQSSVLHGKVTSEESNSPLPGVTVVVKGTTEGTTSDNRGNYTIAAHSGDTLVFSYVGFNRIEKKVTDRSVLNVRLSPESNKLNDVVVIGYGTQLKKDLTGSVGIVHVKEAKKTATYDIARMLQGQAAGVSVAGSGEPGGFVNIKIEGVSSLNNNNPLFVVDGVPTSGPFDFPTDDIESIQILKDASAGAIYGSKAATGVIIITTKKGSQGPLQVNYSGYYGFQNTPKKLPLTDRAQYQKIVNASQTNAGLPLAPANDPNSPDFIDNVNTNWQDAAFKTGIIQNHNVTFSGGANHTTYFVGFNYFNQTATVKGGPGEPKYDRYNFSAKMQSQKGILTFGAKVLYTQSHKQNLTYPHNHPNIGNEIVDLDRAIPTVPVYDSSRLGGFGGADKNTQQAIVLNVIGMNNLMDSYSNRNRFQGNVWAELALLKNLKYRFDVSYDRTDTRDFFFEPKYDLGWYYINSDAYMTDNRGSGYAMIMDNTLTYKLTFGRSVLNLLGGTTYEKDNSGSMTGLESGFNTPYFYSFNTGDPTTASVTSGQTTTVMESYFGRLNYNYNDRYLLTVNFRRDGSSNFSPLNRWGNFGSVAGAWVISNEKFLHLPSFITHLKLRGGYGSVGNQSIPAYSYTTYVNPNANYLFSTYGNPSTQQIAAGTTQTTVADPSIKWETKITSDVGIDLGLLDDELSFTVEYFRNTSKNLLASPPIPLSVGAINTPIVNAASMRNTGFNFSADFRKTFGEVGIDVNANVHTLKNKVLALGGTNAPIYGAESITEVGKPVGEIYGYVTQGIFQTAADVKGHALQPNAAPGDVIFKDVNGDKVITSADQTILGTSIPNLYYGFNFSATYKNFDLSFFLQGNSGNKIVNGLYQVLMAGQYTNHSVDELNFWTPSNTNTDVPRPIIGDPNGNDGPSDRWVKNGSYLRMQNAQIGYTFDGGLLDKTHFFRTARIYVSGQNLFTLTGYNGYDPDIISDGLFSRGFDYGSFPNPRSILFGLQVGF